MSFLNWKMVMKKLQKSLRLVELQPLLIWRYVLKYEFTMVYFVSKIVLKGQIISECTYEIIVSPIRTTKKFPRFLP